jgi:tetratricopeptide (TPR) repeat protein
VRARIRSGSEGYLYLGELYADTGRREKALEHLDFAIAEFPDMKMQPSL